MLNSIIDKNTRSIVVLIGTIMLLFSCKNDLSQVNSLPDGMIPPEMEGYNLTLLYSDSARIKYKVITPQYIKMNSEEDKTEEFPKGINVVSFDADGKKIGTIVADYAKKNEKDMIWVAKGDVVVTNEDGTKVETELMYWDMKNEKIYSDRYTRLSMDGRILEGNDGFESDQNLKNPIVKNITGIVEIEEP